MVAADPWWETMPDEQYKALTLAGAALVLVAGVALLVRSLARRRREVPVWRGYLPLAIAIVVGLAAFVAGLAIALAREPASNGWIVGALVALAVVVVLAAVLLRGRVNRRVVATLVAALAVVGVCLVAADTSVDDDYCGCSNDSVP